MKIQIIVMSANPVDTSSPPTITPAGAAPEARPASTAGGVADTLNAHKGKLAIGVAATLGLMIYYNWREKKLAKTDPDEYARLQRLKAGLRAEEADSQPAAPDKSANES